MVLTAAGCVKSREEVHAGHFTPAAAASSLRSMQSRRFETRDERMLLQAVAGVLQDLGFQIEESQSQVGLVSGSKDRSAVEAGQVAVQVLLVILAAAARSQHRVVMDENQRIRIAVVVRPAPNEPSLVARATMQRVVLNSDRQMSRIETLDEPLLYQEFFNMLSQSAFLTAHEILCCAGPHVSVRAATSGVPSREPPAGVGDNQHPSCSARHFDACFRYQR